MNLSLFDDLAAPVPDRPGPAQPLGGRRAPGNTGPQAAPVLVPAAAVAPASHPPAPTLAPPCEPGADETTALLPDRPVVLATPEVLHPALWRADQLGSGRQISTSSGFATLDAQLPGGGWPHRMLTELLLPHPGIGELRLLAPALAAVSRAAAGGLSAAAQTPDGRCVMLFDPPAQLYASALAQLGVDARQWLVVRGRVPHGRPAGSASRQGPLRQLLPHADVLWALEQALKSGHVGAVLAWLPAPVKADALRRLQLAAQAHDGPAFIFREMDARQRPSAAPLRLELQCGGTDALQLRVLKRRGPPLAQALQLILPPVLSAEPEERALGSRAVVLQLKARRAALARGRSATANSVQQQAENPPRAAHPVTWVR